MMHDLIIRNGLIVDGSGSEPFLADIAIDGQLISRVGTVSTQAKREIDAKGCIVTPGFVDVHTHYDGQVLWDNRLAPSSIHGVTTVIMGNCAVGFAPCKPGEQEQLVKLMAGVEDIPEIVMTKGLEWNWETFPEYLDVLEKRHCDVDFAAQIPHAAVRVYVMGERGVNREMANAEDLQQIKALVQEGIEAGAIGFSTSRHLSHRTPEGELAPAETAAESELIAIAKGLKAAGSGVLEMICDFPGLPFGDTADFDLMVRMAKAADCPLSYTLLQLDSQPDAWQQLLALTAQANAQGAKIRAQVSPRAVGIHYGLDVSFNPFSFRKSYKAIASLPLQERHKRLSEPSLKAAILTEPSEHKDPIVLWMASQTDKMFVVDEYFSYEPSPANSIGSRANQLGISADELAYDELLKNNGRALLYLPVVNFTHGNLGPCYDMMQHPDTVIGLGDGGAHYGLICDGSYPTFCLTHWVRDRKGQRISLPKMINALTQVPAETVGLLDRGLLKAGFKADLNIIDFDNLKLLRPEVHYDLPAGGRRIMQYAQGYIATVLSGVVTYLNGDATDQLPGRLVRGAKAAPQFKQ